MKKHLFILSGFLAAFMVLVVVGPASAQEKDAEECKDHPLVSRMKNFYITSCESNFAAVEFYLSDGVTKTVEGQKTKIEYALQEGSPSPSYLQIRRNYGAAIKSLGGTILYDESRYVSGKVVKDGREIWISAEGFNEGGDYALTVVEVGAMTQEVTAGEMLDALNKDGFIALYINFDTGKSDIKPESGTIIVQITTLLKDNPGLKVSIEGHTDNVGTSASNKTLSEARAKAVADAVAKGGIDASRLSAAGWGQEKPVADNRTEEGRAKNRRVEIVKK